jgi:hypothetical protein
MAILETGVAVKYNVYLRNMIELRFQSADRYRAELAARLLRMAGVNNAEVKKVGGGGVWQVRAAADVLAAGRKELRVALAEIIKTARSNGWVDEKKVKRWLEKLEGVRRRERGRS